MRFPANTGFERLRATRRLLSVFVVLWANLALQPCAIASDTDHDCPHCPPVQEDATAAHHGHHADSEAGKPCASMQSDCCDLDEVNVNARTSQLKVKDVFEQPAVVAVDAPWLDIIAFERPVFTTGPPIPAAASPPIHLLNCVFLN